ncbi:phage tail tape measure protein [Latilactobacillus curvatus]|uniref:phage tail tape measure protein n=1 Tax=Latilactobacillus curvatus TaxID=28038 RepID=UPI0028B57057|nr:phage tail tape measure protein [Latilactobacillus curvatus]MDT7016367.1 phage tail tape measure protein [Latilactobacillus curvatus]
MADKKANVVMSFKSDGEVKLAQTVKELNTVMNTAAKQYRAQMSAMDANAGSTEKLVVQQQKLSTQYEAAQKRTKMLTDEYNRMKDSGEANAASLAKQAGKVLDAQRAENSLKSQLDKANEGLTEQGKKAADAKDKLSTLQQESGELDAKQKALTASFSRQSAEMRKDATETEKNHLKKRELTAQLKLTGDQVKNLESQLHAAETAYGANSKEANELRAQLDNAKTSEINFGKQLTATNTELRKQGDFSDQTAQKLQKIGKAGEKVGTAGKAISAGVTAPVLALGAASVKSFSDMTTAEGSVIDQTGKTGKAAQALRTSFEKVYGNTAADTETVANALGGVTTRFNFTGKAAEDASLKFIQYAKVNKQDVGQAVTDVSRAMGDAGIKSKDYSSVLDQLTVASQKSGIDVSSLADNLAKFGAPMRALGMSTQQSIATFAGWEKAGVNTNIAFSGMKKAISTWGKEGKDSGEMFGQTMQKIKEAPSIADATKIAIENFGQKAGPDLADAIRGGRFEVGEYMEALKKSGGTLAKTASDSANPMKQAQTAAHQFQISLGQLGTVIMATLAPAMKQAVTIMQGLREKFSGISPEGKKLIITIGLVAAAIGPLLIGVGKLMLAFSNIGKGIGALKEGFTLLQGAGGLAGLATKFGGFLVSIGPAVLIIAGIAAAITAIILVIKNWGKITEWLKDTWSRFSVWIGNLWESIKTKTTAVFSAIGEFFKQWGPTILAVLGGPIGLLVKFIIDHWQQIKDTTSNVFNAIKSFLSNLWEGIKSAISNTVNGIKETVSGIWNAIKDTTSNVWNGIKSVTSSVWDGIKSVITSVVNSAKSVVTNVWNGIKSVTSSAWNGIKSITSSVWNGISSVISGVVNGIRNTISNVWEGIRNTTSNVWNGIKSAMTGPVESAKNIIGGIVDRIKGFFSGIHLSLPRINMPALPHFKLNGSFSLKPPSVPHLGVDWYAKGGIFTKPTIFGQGPNGLKGAGEAGPEAALPLNAETLGAIGKGIASNMPGQNNGPVYLQIDGQTFGQIVGPYVDQYMNVRANDLNYGRGY